MANSDSEHTWRRVTVASDDPDRIAKVSPAIDRLAWILDDAIEIPVIGRRVGLDGIVGLIPGAGQAAGLAASLPVVLAGIFAGVSIPTVVHMMINLAIDAIVGSIPFAGNVFDFVWKSNERNIRLIRSDLVDHERTRRRSIWAIVISLVVLIAAMVAIVVAMFAVAIVCFMALRAIF